MLIIGIHYIRKYQLSASKTKRAQTSVIRYSGLPQPTLSYEEIHANGTGFIDSVLLLLILSRW